MKTTAGLRPRGFVQVTTGARSDLQHATRRARHLVMECGMSDVVGPVFVESREGRSMGSPETAKRVDEEIGRILRESYAKVTSLLVCPTNLSTIFPTPPPPNSRPLHPSLNLTLLFKDIPLPPLFVELGRVRRGWVAGLGGPGDLGSSNGLTLLACFWVFPKALPHESYHGLSVSIAPVLSSCLSSWCVSCTHQGGTVCAWAVHCTAQAGWGMSPNAGIW